MIDTDMNRAMDPTVPHGERLAIVKAYMAARRRRSLRRVQRANEVAVRSYPAVRRQVAAPLPPTHEVSIPLPLPMMRTTPEALIRARGCGVAMQACWRSKPRAIQTMAAWTPDRIVTTYHAWVERQIRLWESEHGPAPEAMRRFYEERAAEGVQRALRLSQFGRQTLSLFAMLHAQWLRAINPIVVASKRRLRQRADRESFRSLVRSFLAPALGTGPPTSDPNLDGSVSRRGPPSAYAAVSCPLGNVILCMKWSQC